MTETKKERRSPRTKGSGSIFRTSKSKYWQIAYTVAGVRHFESSESEKKGDAQALLTSKLGDAGKGIAVSPKIGKVSLRDGLQAVIDDQKTRGRKSIEHTQRRIDLHLLPYFGPDRRMSTITGQDVEAYRAHRMTEETTEEARKKKAAAALATTNRELAVLRRAFRLAQKRGVLMTIPNVEMPKEHNVRTGFFEHTEFEAVREALPVALRGVATFAYYTGWRRSEVLTLQWSNVDRDRKVISLDVGSTKNNEGRVLPYDLLPELVDVIDTAWAEHERLVKAQTICPFIFHRNGKEIRDFRTVWESACIAAKCPDKILHDFRRTAARNLVRAGVPEKAAMGVTGHATRSVFDRYNIVTGDDVRNALGALATAKPATTPRKGQVQRFKPRKSA